ncbi:unnamed protein product [Darwinula stevensoni]|uniref:Acid ceramidase n=1 Tax=Darwinula stevensoni TaxID=69355 RepID=A0A7R8XBZ1_9CRUS|nr:unnamed protein product [Darwinula stevensoni]CAG0886982.1 unnamed protein product [Darwinula stevensoni]
MMLKRHSPLMPDWCLYATIALGIGSSLSWTVEAAVNHDSLQNLIFRGSQLSIAIPPTNTRRRVENFVCSKNEYPPPIKDRVESYKVDLDSDPRDRWSQLVKLKKQELQTLVGDVKEILGGMLLALLDDELPLLAHTLPSPYREEIIGIADATGIPLGEVTLYNIFYEVFTFCTSIIAKDISGTIIHGRNLDFGLFLGWDKQNNTWRVTEHLRPLVVETTFIKGGQVLYKSTGFVGHIGILTAVKPGAFSLSIDERFGMDAGILGILKWILGDRSGTWLGFLTRSVMEEETTYEAALRRLSDTRLLAPVYFILAGPSTGAVVTRWKKKYDVWELDDKAAAPWYLVETNYDHWDKPPFFDNRRDPAIACLERAGQHALNRSLLYDVLSTRPILNKLTTYTSLMEPSSGALESWLRWCPDPCPTW